VAAPRAALPIGSGATPVGAVRARAPDLAQRPGRHGRARVVPVDVHDVLRLLHRQAARMPLGGAKITLFG